MASSGAASAMRRASTEIENALLNLGEYACDPDVRPSVRRSIQAAVTRGNDIANRLAVLADQEQERQP